MDNIKRVAVINDLSCFGRGPLSIIIPVMSVLGHQVCPLPTAVMSTHTGGFSGFTRLDLGSEMERIADHWKELGIGFDAIYSGYLGSGGQINAAKRFFSDFGEKAFKCVDPVLGDEGELYDGITGYTCDGVRSLISGCDITTPNYTEACFLLEKPYSPGEISRTETVELLRGLRGLGAKSAVITGINMGKKIGVAAYDGESGDMYLIKNDRVDAFFPGTGDMFASVMLGMLLRGESLSGSIRYAAGFSLFLIRKTIEAKTPERESLIFEPYLSCLTSPGEFELECEKF